MIDKEGALHNVANYRNNKNLMFLLNNLHNLYNIAHKGNQTALCIYMDIMEGLKSDKLTENQRKCIWMKYYGKENNVYIAKELGIDESTVRKNLHGGIKRLGKIIEKEM